MLRDKPKIIPTHETVFDGEWFKVKKNDNFYYGERLGTNSVAFVLVSKESTDPKPYGVVKEYKDPIDQFVITAFGGSIDEEEYRNDLEHLVQVEVAEESGFRVEKEDIWYLGKVFVSTQMNQYCHLFIVYVDKNEAGPKTTTNPTELTATVVWLDGKEVVELEDWKAATILSKKVLRGL